LGTTARAVVSKPPKNQTKATTHKAHATVQRAAVQQETVSLLTMKPSHRLANKQKTAKRAAH
jgi:hypothetical protein